MTPAWYSIYLRPDPHHVHEPDIHSDILYFSDTRNINLTVNLTIIVAYISLFQTSGSR